MRPAELVTNSLSSTRVGWPNSVAALKPEGPLQSKLRHVRGANRRFRLIAGIEKIAAPAVPLHAADRDGIGARAAKIFLGQPGLPGRRAFTGGGRRGRRAVVRILAQGDAADQHAGAARIS